jgi:cytochrome P450
VRLTRTTDASSLRLPPGPPALPIIGHLLQVQHDHLGFLLRCAREYGDVVPLKFGPVRGILLSHPADIEDVMVRKNRSFAKGRFYALLRPLLGEGLLTSEGDFWLRQRRLAQPAFHHERIAGYGQVMVHYTQDMLATWAEGERRDVSAEMSALTLRVVARALLDADITADARDVGETLAVAAHELDDEVNGPSLLVPPAWPTPGRRRLAAAVRRLDRIVYRVIQQRRSAGDDRGDLLAMLLRAQDADGSLMTDRQVRDEAMTIVVAGHETTALALAWTWYLLATHPEAEAVLHHELHTVLHGQPPTLADLPRLRYTDMVVRETLRLYPPSVELGRETIAPVEIGGYLLPPGTNVLFSPWVVHRDPRWFPEPDRFRPERWADAPGPDADGSLAQRLPRFAYFPFGGGPRLCIGQQFALMEAVLLVAAIAQHYRLVLEPGTRVQPDPSLTLRFKGGLPMLLERRPPDDDPWPAPPMA